MSQKNRKKQSSVGWEDFIITGTIEILILSTSFFLVLQIHRWHALSLFSWLLLIYCNMVILTLVVLKIIRTLFPLEEGIYSFGERPMFYIWNLQGYLCFTNLFLQYDFGILPMQMKKFFYQLLGAKMGKGMIPIYGKLINPAFITIEEGVVIGPDATVDALAVMPGNKLVIGKVHLKKGVLIGTKAAVGPWVTIGENSIVSVMSMVPMFTQIPANEVWAGVPAKKVGVVPVIELNRP